MIFIFPNLNNLYFTFIFSNIVQHGYYSMQYVFINRYIEGSLFFLSEALILLDHLEAGIAKCTAVAA